MAEQQTQTTKDFGIGDFFSENVLEAELSEGQMKIKKLNDATITEKLQWEKRFAEYEARVVALENRILKIMEAKGELKGKINSARILMQGHLKDFPLTSETEGLFKNVLRVLDPNPDEFTTKVHRAQQTMTSDTRDALSSVTAGSSLGVSKSVAQNLGIPVTPVKRRQASVANEASQNKVRRKERSSTSKMTLRSQTRKLSNKSSVSKAPSKIGESGTGDVPPQIDTAQAPLLSPTSGLQSTTNSLNMEKSPSAAEPRSVASRDIITIETIPRAPVQSGTLHLTKNVNENCSLTPIQIQQQAVEAFSKSLLKNKKLDESTKVIIEKLCGRLKLNAVALKLAVSYINELVLTDPLKSIIENYLIKIDNDMVVRGVRKVAESVENPCYLTWRVTCEKIRETPGIGENALKFMEITSFLAVDNIPTQFVWYLYDSMENMENSTTRKNIFLLLKRFSVINSNSGESFTVPPFIQDAIRNDLEEQVKSSEILGEIKSSAHEMIKKNGVSFDEMIHIQSIWEHVTKRADLIKEDGTFPSSISRRLVELGKYREAIDFSIKALSILVSTLGENHRSTLRIKSRKGVALFNFGEYLKAVEVLTEVYEKEKELFGEEDDHCLLTANRIGLVHWTFEKYDEALEWCRIALRTRERISSKEHPRTLTLKDNIAGILDDQGKYQEALEFYQQVLEVEERVRGKEDPYTVDTKFKVAIVRFRQGNYEDALKIFQEVVEAEERVLELDHPDTLITKAWIADTYVSLRRKEEAIQLYKEVLEKRQEKLGAEHPQTVNTKSRVATLRFGLGKHKDALKIFEEVLEVRERVLGVDHPHTLATKKWIAALLARTNVSEGTRNGK